MVEGERGREGEVWDGNARDERIEGSWIKKLVGVGKSSCR